jgi:hypothetical protein
MISAKIGNTIIAQDKMETLTRLDSNQSRIQKKKDPTEHISLSFKEVKIPIESVKLENILNINTRELLSKSIKSANDDLLSQVMKNCAEVREFRHNLSTMKDLSRRGSVASNNTLNPPANPYYNQPPQPSYPPPAGGQNYYGANAGGWGNQGWGAR